MQTTKTIMFFLTLSALIFLLPGCPVAEKPLKIVLTPHSNQEQGPDSGALEKRFQQSSSQGPSAVESAIELSKKYAKLSEQAAEMRQNNNELIGDNNQLKDQLTTCQAQLEQTKKELAEANDLLIEMRIELNNWKTNILGFRDEMRNAEKTQLQALLDIFKILGGEVKKKSAQDENAGLSPVSAKEPDQLQPLSLNTGKISGETK